MKLGHELGAAAEDGAIDVVISVLTPERPCTGPGIGASGAAGPSCGIVALASVTIPASECEMVSQTLDRCEDCIGSAGAAGWHVPAVLYVSRPGESLASTSWLLTKEESTFGRRSSTLPKSAASRLSCASSS